MGASGGDGGHPLSVAGGIAAPGASTAIFQNPAGIAYNERARILLAVEGPGTTGSVPTADAGLLYGQDSFGLGVGISHELGNANGTGAFYGLGVKTASDQFALGVSGESSFSPTSGTSINVGVLFRPQPAWHLGITAFDVGSGGREWGFGAGYEISSNAMLVMDFIANSGFANFAAEPGLSVGTRDASIMISYGFRLNGGYVYSRTLREGLSAGASLALGNSMLLQAYYNAINKYYVAVVFGI